MTAMFKDGDRVIANPNPDRIASTPNAPLGIHRDGEGRGPMQGKRDVVHFLYGIVDGDPIDLNAGKFEAWEKAREALPEELKYIMDANRPSDKPFWVYKLKHWPSETEPEKRNNWNRALVETQWLEANLSKPTGNV